jgi:hypothetical protein
LAGRATGRATRETSRAARSFTWTLRRFTWTPLRGTPLEVQRVTTSLENFFKPKGTYTFKVLVASNNARPRWIPVEFAFDPAHDRLEFKPVNRTRYPWWGRWRWLRSRQEWR